MSTSKSTASGLSGVEATRVVQQGMAAAETVKSMEGMRSWKKKKLERPCRHVVVVVDREGRILAQDRHPDAWVGSIDIAIAKARTAAFFSSDENALTSRMIGTLSQPGMPLWGIGHTNHPGTSGDKDTRNALVTFAGGIPLFKGGKLVGAVGVSGDGVDQDEMVAFKAAEGFEPSDEVVVMGMELPKHVDELKTSKTK
jgi:uncharacterized protein GlcG (DUF336 family)